MLIHPTDPVADAPGDLRRKIYQSVLDEQLQVVSSSRGGYNRGSDFTTLSLLHAMREVCNHPASLKKDRRPKGCHISTATDVQISGKCEKLHELLDVMLANGHLVTLSSRCLAFL